MSELTFLYLMRNLKKTSKIPKTSSGLILKRKLKHNARFGILSPKLFLPTVGKAVEGQNNFW